MQMEQQKILWIIFSVALFILVIVGVGVIWFLPTNHKGVATAGAVHSKSTGTISFDPYEWAKSQKNNYPGLEKSSPSSGSSQSQSNGGNFTIIYGQQPGQGQGQSSPQAAAKPRKAAPPASTQRRPAPARQAAPKPRPKPTPRPKPAPKHQAPAATHSVSHPHPAPQTKRVVQHWIQVAAFESDFRAQRAKKLLSENGIAGKISSRVVRGHTFFRVRVGPYKSKQQAEKFLTQIKKISEFSHSYISLVYAMEKAN